MTHEPRPEPPSAGPDQALARITPTQLTHRPISMPAVSLDEARERYHALVNFVRELMQDGVDYGTIPGTGNKRTLLKPGAEKLTTFFGLSTNFQIIERVEDWTGSAHDGEPFFYYLYRCRLLRGDRLIAEADGSCNSWEKKYRYRKGEIVCPDCGVAAIIKGKVEYGGGWVCFRKKGGCNAKFPDSQFSSDAAAQVPNKEIFDQVNTLQKMAEKRALIAATLLAVNASEFFTQDLEDLLDVEAAPVIAEPEFYNAPDYERGDEQATQRVTIRPMTERQADALKLVNDGAVSKTEDRYRIHGYEVWKDERDKARCTCDEYRQCVAADARFRCPHMIAARLWAPSKDVEAAPTRTPRWTCAPATRARLETAIKAESESGLKGAFTHEAIVQAIRETWSVAELHALTEEQAVAAAERVESHLDRLRDGATADAQGAQGSTKSRAGGNRR
jgi:hypothetical protein